MLDLSKRRRCPICRRFLLMLRFIVSMLCIPLCILLFTIGLPITGALWVFTGKWINCMVRDWMCKTFEQVSKEWNLEDLSGEEGYDLY